MNGVLGLNRRSLLATAVGAALPDLTVAQGQVEFLVLTMTTKNFPFNTLANCAELNKSVALFAAESKRAKDSPQTVAAEISKRVDDRRAALQKAISDAKTALANAKVDEAFVFVNTGISLTLLGLGAAFTGPLALGVLAGASVLTGASSFALQAYFRKGSDQLSFVTGYGQGRAMMFAEIATAASAPVLSTGLNAVGYFVAANEYATVQNDKTKAAILLTRSVKGLEKLEKELAAIGADKTGWAKLYEDINKAAQTRLMEFVAANKASDCILLPGTAKGPIIIKS